VEYWCSIWHISITLNLIIGKTIFAPSNYHSICNVFLNILIFAMSPQSTNGVAMSHFHT
jgi:hypothetical protein